jgi:Mg-chelatase subunit ChlI
MLDRFAVSLELGHIGALKRDQIATVSRNREELCDAEMTTELMNALRADTGDRQKLSDVRHKQARFSATLKKHGLKPFEEGELEQLVKELQQPKLNQDAMIFLDMLDAEMNHTPLYGLKRRSDPIDASTHGMALASAHVVNALSPRASLAIEQYAQAFARLTGREGVSKDDITTVAPYVLAHRLEPTDDFKAAYAEKQRATRGPENLELANRLVKDVESRYAAVHKSLALLDNYRRGTLTGSQKAEARKLLTADPDKIDHPLLRQYIADLKQNETSE